VRDELLSVELFSCLTEAQVMIEDRRQDYNHHRPHSSLRMLTPAHYSQTIKLQTNTNHQLSSTVDQ
jgi:transposase InsO family protein